MMKRILLSLFFLTLAAAPAWAKPNWCGWEPPAHVVEMLHKEPAAEARAALERGDRRLFAVRGFSTYVPGAEDSMARPDYVVIEGTGHVFCSKAEERFNHRAYEYARRYNSHILYGYAIEPMKISLEEMLGKDPEIVAKEALERGDGRLLGVYGHKEIETPGSGKMLWTSLHRGVRMIEENSDHLTDFAGILFNETARKYAGRYNHYITESSSWPPPFQWGARQWPPPPGPYQWEGWKTVLANPVSKARAALERGDRRLMVVEGETTEAPGAGMSAFKADKRFGIVVIADTRNIWFVGGAYDWYSHKFFERRAGEYATEYNRYVVRNASIQ